MKSEKLRIRSWVVVALLAVMVTISSCSKKIDFMPSTVVPAADGKVKVKKDRNGNYAVNVKVDNLADPSRLKSPASHYVVWVETEANGSKNLGRLATNTGLFSNSLSGSLETVTPYKPVRFFITAEDQGNTQYPGMTTVLRTDINN